MPKTWKDTDLKTMKAHIITRLWEGESLRKILKKQEIELPARQTIYSWLNPNSTTFDETFLDYYTQAREDQADLHSESILDIARRVIKGKVDPAAGRVAIQALQWTAGKMKPKKYGDKLDISHEGEIGGSINIYHIPDNGRDKLPLNGQEEKPH